MLVFWGGLGPVPSGYWQLLMLLLLWRHAGNRADCCIPVEIG
jgi:hypothetical protein